MGPRRGAIVTRVSCPGRGAAFFMPLRRAGTVPNTGVRYGPGSAAHRSAKSYALRCVRGTRANTITRQHRCLIDASSNPASPPLQSPHKPPAHRSTKSSNLACLPGIQSCNSSSTPIRITAVIAVSNLCLGYATPKASPTSTKASACSLSWPRSECGRSRAGPSVAKTTAAVSSQAMIRRMRFMRSG